MQPGQGKQKPLAPPDQRLPVGLWRDGRWLVIDLHRHVFPPRCVKSNAPLAGHIEPFRISVAGADWMEVEKLREQVEQAEDDHSEWDATIRFRDHHRAGTEVIVDLRLPIAADWRRRVQSPWSARVAWLGFALLAVFCGLQWGWQRGWIADITASPWLWPAIVSCFLSSWFLKWRQTRVVPVHRFEEGKLWLGGVHREWLRGLPEFVPSREFIARRLWEQGPQLWLTMAVSAIFFGLILLTHSAGFPSEGFVRGMIVTYLLIGGAGILIANNARQRIAQLQQLRKTHYPDELPRHVPPPTKHVS